MCDLSAKGQKRAKYLKILAKMYKIWKYIEKGQTARMGPGYMLKCLENVAYHTEAKKPW